MDKQPQIIIEEKVRGAIVEILDRDSNIKKLYDDVTQKLTSQNKTLIIWSNIAGSRNEYCGNTEENGNEVIITIDYDLLENREKLTSVLIHELGEVDYIMCNLPKLTSKEGGFESRGVKDIREILTHNHVRRIINKYNLNEEIEKIGEESNQDSNLENKCFKVIKIVHNMMTYFWNENIQCDEDIKVYVQEIKDILDDADTINDNTDIIMKKYKKIIDIIINDLHYNNELISLSLS